MTNEEKELTITYLTKMQEEYIEGEGYERHPLPKYYALDSAIKALEQPTMDKAMIHTLAKENDELKAEIGRLRQALEQQLSEDCVSRAEMLKYQQYLHGKMSNEENHKLWEFIKDLPRVTPTFPKGATNGDMMKAMFPSLKVEDNGSLIYLHYPSGVWIVIDKNWWNAPYKRKRGDEND